ncbi:hypothetical protein [Bradyrhizobium elkanii]
MGIGTGFSVSVISPGLPSTQAFIDLGSGISFEVRADASPAMSSLLVSQPILISLTAITLAFCLENEDSESREIDFRRHCARSNGNGKRRRSTPIPF